MTGFYRSLCAQIEALTEGCALPLPALSNCAALLWGRLERINWAGFYLLKGDTLYLGPFQGKIACTQIRTGRGVCGTAVARDATQLVPDVHAFPGHIACDSASRSEVVIPLHVNGRIVGVLDIDSPETGRFTQEDADGLKALTDALLAAVDWSRGIL